VTGHRRADPCTFAGRKLGEVLLGHPSATWSPTQSRRTLQRRWRLQSKST
jgi:hypothetical protein